MAIGYVLERTCNSTTRPKVMIPGLWLPWVNIHRFDEGISENILFMELTGFKIPKIRNSCH